MNASWEHNFKPYLGQRVTLNAAGYQELGLRSKEAFDQAQEMRIIAFENINADAPPDSPEIWVVQVDKPLIDMFLIDTTMLTPLDDRSGYAIVI